MVSLKVHRNPPRALLGPLGLRGPWASWREGRLASAPALCMWPVLVVKAEGGSQPGVSHVSPGGDFWRVGRVARASVPRAPGSRGRRAGRGGAGGRDTCLREAEAWEPRRLHSCNGPIPAGAVGAGRPGVPRASQWPSRPRSRGWPSPRAQLALRHRPVASPLTPHPPLPPRLSREGEVSAAPRPSPSSHSGLRRDGDVRRKPGLKLHQTPAEVGTGPVHGGAV